MTDQTTRRNFLLATLAAGAIAPFAVAQASHGRDVRSTAARRRPRPTPSQLAWQRDELAMFIHFGVNSFTDREWGDGSESPAIFNPVALDARQWARSARAAGFRAMVLTAKHHDGFCLWPTATTSHSVRSAPWRGGDGDLVREFVDACRAEGLRPGLYLSPWDRNAPSYGDSPRYNDLYVAQLTELLTRYGAIHEVWFDGANGEGPNGKRQVYDWGRTWRTVKALQPEAVIFSDAGPDVRWIGNETGVAGETNWSTVDPGIVPVPGMTGDEVMRSLREGDREGTVWRPGETDVSIRPGWFHHPAEDDRVKSVDALSEIFMTSVGRNSKLLLNVPPTRAGLLHQTDIARLMAMRERRERIFADDLAGRRTLQWAPAGDTRAEGVVVLDRVQRVGLIELREPIEEGQRVARHLVEGRIGGEWRELVRGTTIGYRRITRIAPVALEAVRIRVEDAVEPPRPVEVRVYGEGP